MAREIAPGRREEEALRRYHERTKHSPESVRTGGGRLDWSNEPAKEKRLRGIDPVPMPRVPLPSPAAALDALAGSSAPEGDTALTSELLSALLFLTAGVHRTRRIAGGREHGFRTYASAGALYPNEIYVSLAPGVIEAGPGLYHYHPREHALGRLRDEDVRGAMAEAIADAAARESAAVLVLTGIPWRTAWKYRSRGYRHLWWDGGMMLANLLAATAATGLRARSLLGFADRGVDHILGIDGATEMSLAVVPLGGDAALAPDVALAPLDHDVEPISPRAERDPDIEAAHAASSLGGAEAVRAWRSSSRPMIQPGRPQAATKIRPLHPLSPDSLDTVVRRRGSSRRLTGEAIPAAEAAALLQHAAGDVPFDATVPVEIHLVANALGGLDPGSAYRWLGDGHFERLATGIDRRVAGMICLEQSLGADAASVVFPMVDLDEAFERLGARGYRVAQLQASVVAGRLILGAYAQCLGASGITFYDDEVSRVLGVPELSPMIGVVMGREALRRSIVACRSKRERTVEP